MIAIIDYDMGNLRSVQKACQYVGCDAVVTSDAEKIKSADRLILPGVGAARDAIENLKKKELWQLILDQAAAGKPLLGICLGMQLLFDKSLENGENECLGLVGGQVVPFETELRVPHIGWNDLSFKDSPIFAGLPENPYVFFVHSYHAAYVAEENIIATSNYGYEFTAAVQNGNVFGTQFHPEKSGELGVSIIKNFGGLKL